VFALSPQRDAVLHEETGDLDLFCIADPFFLKGAFRNVLENSLAVCPDSVRITISCSAAELSNRPALRVAVRDNGPGFNAEQRQHLFEPFYTTKLKGTGLGLALVRRVVEAHGGHVAAGEGPLPGAEIVFTLPRSQP
jgi:signal transduction histidine kinase